MQRMSVGFLVLAFVGLCAVGCQSGSAPAARSSAAKPVTIVQRFAGSDPGLIAPQVLLITSPAQLRETGSQILAHKPVDFTRYSLVLLALGEQPTGGYWGCVVGVQRSGRTLFVQAQANRPDAQQPVAMVRTYPYAAAVIPKFTVMQVKSDIQSLVGQAAPVEETE
ncbi:MAG: protease complex subunit PrcB family protein [Phycisphaeraceae bacterium]|nr:protease complex subunit PrcB family protein [Phycisphaeraceae bacterium]